MERMEDSLVKELGADTRVEVIDVIKTEERLCYDAWWIFKTSLGYFRLKTYDGISENRMRELSRNVTTVEELNNLQPKCFYYD
jgi:hypothetical protein